MKDSIHLLSGIMMTTFYILCGVPQIVKTFRTKSAKDISVGTLLLSIGGHSSASIYAMFGANNFWVFVCYFGGLATSITMLVLWWLYGK